MSNHKDSLVKVLEYLVNEDREKASDLLHDVFVEKAKNHWASLSESDESVEEDIQDEDLDETYEVEEGINNFDAEEDFLDDIETAEDEIEAEEVYGEDEDQEGEEEEAPEMDMDMEVDMDSGEEEDAAEPEEALANVEDAIAELRAAFADMMDDEPAEEPEMEEEVAFESDDSDDEEVEAVEEGATMSAVSVSHTDGSDNSKSPVGPGDSSMSPSKPVDIAGGTVEAGGKAPAAKDMGVTGPQEAGSPTPAPAPKREMK
jgi:hypothetical protein